MKNKGLREILDRTKNPDQIFNRIRELLPNEIDREKNTPNIATSAYNWNNGWNACLRDIKERMGL